MLFIKVIRVQQTFIVIMNYLGYGMNMWEYKEASFSSTFFFISKIWSLLSINVCIYNRSISFIFQICFFFFNSVTHKYNFSTFWLLISQIIRNLKFISQCKSFSDMMYRLYLSGKLWFDLFSFSVKRIHGDEIWEHNIIKLN